MINTLHFHSGDKKYKIYALVARCGSDIIVIVGGGEKPHVGSVSMAVSHPSLKDSTVLSSTASVLTVTGHKEDRLAQAASLRLSRILESTVVVSVGIHIDNASKEDISRLVDNFNSLIKKVEEELRA